MGPFSFSMPLLCPTGQTKVLVHRERWTTIPQIAHERYVRPNRRRGEPTRYFNYPLAPFRRLLTHDVQDARCSCSDFKISRRATRMALDAVGRCMIATRACVLTVMPRSRGWRHRPPLINSCPKLFLGAITPQVATRIAIRRGRRYQCWLRSNC